MKKLLVLVAMLCCTAFVRAAEPLPTFNAVLAIGKEHRFVLVSAAGKSSSFLQKGDKFEDYTIKSYDAKANTLEVERAGKVSTLALVGDAAVGNAPTPAKATLADAEEVFRTMRFDEMMGKMIDSQKKAMAPMLQQSMGQAISRMKLSEEDKAAFLAFQTKAFDDVMSSLLGPEMRSDMAKIYSEVFSKDELNGLATFYGTPVGQALVDKTPDVTAKMQAAMMPRMMESMGKMQQAQKDFMMNMAAKNAAANGGAAPMPAPTPKP